MQPCASPNKYINMNITHCTFQLIYGMCDYVCVRVVHYMNFSFFFFFFFAFFLFVHSFSSLFFAFFSSHSVTRYAVILMHAFHKLNAHTLTKFFQLNLQCSAHSVSCQLRICSIYSQLLPLI